MPRQLFISEEDEIIRSCYPAYPPAELIAAVVAVSPTGEPRWNYDQISDRAKLLGIRRDRTAIKIARLTSDNLGADEGEAKWQALLRQNEYLIKRIRETQAERDFIADIIDARLAKIEPILPPPLIISHHPHTKPEVASLLVSDIHGGEVVKSRDIGGLGAYNWDVLVKRCHTLRDAVLECIGIVRSSLTINKLVINFLGDLVTGEDIYIGQGRNIDLALVDQVFDLADLLATDLLVPFAQTFSVVSIYGVWGNHGRAGLPGTHSPRTNWDYVLYRYLKSRMSQAEHIHFYISECNFMGYRLPELPRWKHLLVHGDQARGWASIPYYGVDRMTARYVDMTKVPWDYVYLGHHHSRADIDGQKIMNGSWVGPSEYSVSKLMKASEPTQVLMGLNEKYGQTWLWNLKLDVKKPLEADEDGIYTPVHR